MDERLKTNIIVLYTILLFLFIGIIIGLINHHNWIHPLTQPTEDADAEEILKYNLCKDSGLGFIYDERFEEYNCIDKTGLLYKIPCDCINGCMVLHNDEDLERCIGKPLRTTAEPVRVGKAVCKESSSCIQELINNQEWIDRILVEESKGKSFSKLDDYAQSSVLFLARETCYVDECIKPQSQAKELG